MFERLKFWRNPKKEIEDLFCRFMPSRLLRGSAAGLEFPLNKLSSGRIEYVFVYVVGDTPNSVAENIGRVAEIAKANRWDMDFFCNVILLFDGIYPFIAKEAPPLSDW